MRWSCFGHEKPAVTKVRRRVFRVGVPILTPEERTLAVSFEERGAEESVVGRSGCAAEGWGLVALGLHEL